MHPTQWPRAPGGYRQSERGRVTSEEGTVRTLHNHDLHCEQGTGIVFVRTVVIAGLFKISCISINSVPKTRFRRLWEMCSQMAFCLDSQAVLPLQPVRGRTKACRDPISALEMTPLGLEILQCRLPLPATSQFEVSA